MNVRIVLFLPLVFLIAIILPTIAAAEKGSNQTEVKGKQVQNVQEKPSSTGGNSKSKPNGNENAAPKATSVNKGQNDNNSETKSQKPTNLPDEANAKAKEAVQKVATKKEKEEKPKPSQPKQKESVSNSSKSNETSKGNQKTSNKPVTLQEALPIAEEKKSSGKVDKTDQKKSDMDESNNDDQKEEKDSTEIPIPLPAKKAGELHIFQATQPVKTPVGTSSDHKGVNKSISDFIEGSSGEIGVRFFNPFILRQHVFRNQWVNAPPAPPPKFALSF